MAAAFGLLIAVGATACGSSSKPTGSATASTAGTSGGTSATSAPATGTPLVIGTVISQTTPAGSTTVGSETVNAWVKWTNAHGGIA
ncbi:MAG TPA: hypothetical protein VHU17_07785 [Acidimicrobiales bacterium]|nr:hypothetical protein [Acidimicrobiales bacterium]